MPQAADSASLAAELCNMEELAFGAYGVCTA